jgi:hypothetical protein
LAATIRNSRKTPKDRRWAFEGKALALALIKCSPKSNILLQTLNPLPSRRTVQFLLNTVHFKTDIITHVFGALVHSVQKMSGKDCYCILMFDELLVRENVCFNQKFDCIKNFEDLGNQSGTCNIMNYLLVFMVRGLRRKWE